MLTLETLRDHAASKPNHKFPLGDCEKCLAADLTGKVMAGHDSFVGGEKVPPALASFTRGVCSARFLVGNTKDSQGTLTGAQIAEALDKIIAGADAYLTGSDAWVASHGG